MLIKRGGIYYADLGPYVGSEQGGMRPVLVIQNDTGNKFSPTVIVAALTSNTSKTCLPTHVKLPACKCNMERDSLVLLEQIRTIDKKRLKHKITELDEEIMDYIDSVLKISLGIEETGRCGQFHP
jgi:mRNA interferase MazF